MSRRRLVLPRERSEKAATAQQLGLESSDVSYIVALAEIEGRLEVFHEGVPYFLTPAIDEIAI